MRRGAPLTALAALAACSGSLEGVGGPVGADVVVDVVDASPDVTAPDAEPNAVVDEDAAPDAEPDAPPDASMDASPDRPDAAVDVAPDRPDAAPDAPAPTGAVQYPADRTHSPITADLAARLRAVATRGASLQGNVFSKVGASNTVNTNYLACFAGANVDLAGRDHLRATIDWFRAGDAGGTDPYRRVSLAATVGWSAWAALAGSPSPLAREYDAARPRYATVMYGTDDIQSRDIIRYGQNLLDLADQSLARGVVPLFTTIPARADDPAADAWVPRYTAVMRAVAQTRGVPFIDTWRVLATLPGRGVGSDGLHLNVYTVGTSPRGCVFTAEGLRYGHNTRNLLTLEALDRVRAVVRGGSAPDADAPRLAGEGTPTSPFVVAAMPFGDARDTATGGTRAIARYACQSAANESGAEFYYRVRVTAATRVRAMVVTRDAVDVDVHLLTGGITGDRCVARDDKMLVADLAPGEHTFVVDTYVGADGAPRAGEYLFVLVRE